MLKKMGIRKLAVTTSALFVIGLLYLFPTSKVELNKKISYIDENKLSEVYLLDKYNYVSEVSVVVDEEELENKLKEKLDLITYKNSNKEKIPSSFKGIIPEGTSVLSLKVENDTCTVDFSKELLKINSIEEEKLIEAIIYTLTSEKEIKKVIINVEGKLLERLPNSNKLLNSPLDRTYGINKDYDINSIYNMTKTTVYYTGSSDDLTYYVPVTKVTNDKNEKITVIVSELKSSLLYQSNLSSYLSSKAELKKYEQIEDVMNLTFNDKIFDSIYDQNILEEVAYTIGMSVLENYDVSKVVFYVDEREILTFE